jgi:hypothetical protein
MVLKLIQSTNQFFKKTKIYTFNHDDHQIDNLVSLLISKYNLPEFVTSNIERLINDIIDDSTFKNMLIYEGKSGKYNITIFYETN